MNQTSEKSAVIGLSQDLEKEYLRLTGVSFKIILGKIRTGFL